LAGRAAGSPDVVINALIDVLAARLVGKWPPIDKGEE
jgi:hypothetical protein